MEGLIVYVPKYKTHGVIVHLDFDSEYPYTIRTSNGILIICSENEIQIKDKEKKLYD